MRATMPICEKSSQIGIFQIGNQLEILVRPFQNLTLKLEGAPEIGTPSESTELLSELRGLSIAFSFKDLYLVDEIKCDGNPS